MFGLTCTRFSRFGNQVYMLQILNEHGKSVFKLKCPQISLDPTKY